MLTRDEREEQTELGRVKEEKETEEFEDERSLPIRPSVDVKKAHYVPQLPFDGCTNTECSVLAVRV